MEEATGNGSRWTIGRVLRAAASVMVFAGAIIQPEVVAIAAPGQSWFYCSDPTGYYPM
jgi:hypothetical protein